MFKPQTLKPQTKLLGVLCALCGFLLVSGCERQNERRVVLYTSIDQPIAAPIIRDFEQKTGIRVTLVTDSEASKTVGLAERLRAEKSNPQADVYWGNEPFHTINLAEEGILAPYHSPSSSEVLPVFKDSQHRWTGNGLRARVISVWEQWAQKPTRHYPPDGLHDLHDPELREKIAMARPTAGTTGGHVAALYRLWGEAKADEYFRELRNNGIKLLGGNSVVADQVGRTQLLAGLTDNDDVLAAKREGANITFTLPDQNSLGTLMIPTTIGLVTGAKHPEEAKKLIDYLLSADVEQKLIDAKFAGWSVRKPSEVKPMDVDYREVARIMPTAVRRATAILEGRE